ncbi:ABC transporter substrate-binding protein [Brucellaceae bacterium C25G]
MKKASLAVIAAIMALGTQAYAQPEGYPQDYDALIAQAEKEGKLLIYTNLAEDNINPVIKAFNEAYPNIKVQSLEMGPSEAFSRYRAETGTGIASADILIANTIIDWLNASDEGLMIDYQSPERAYMPEWSYKLPGVYTFSADPMVTIYNKLTVPEELQVSSMKDYFANIASHPEVFKGKVGTYDGRYAFGGSINYAFVGHHGDETWDWFEKAGPSIRAGGGAGNMLEGTLSGELSSAYFVSAPVTFSKIADGLGEIIGWNFPSDGTPVFPRGMGIPQKAKNPAAAKVFLDFVLSEAGQKAVADGKLVPYRPGLIAEGDLSYSLDEVIKEVGGEENIFVIDYDRKMLENNAAFTKRWGDAFKM